MMDYQEIVDLDRLISCISREVCFRKAVLPGVPGLQHEQARREIDTMTDVLEFLQAERAAAFTGQL